jgi:Pentapeptide repeats (9 copies)
MAGLADDWPENQQTCVDVLCAYLRLPYEPDPGEEAPVPERLAFRASREVRHTVIRVITAHLQHDAAVSWQGLNFDFTGVVFDGGSFAGAVFSGGEVIFGRAVFCGTVYFSGAQFSGGEVSFGYAQFSGGTVDFSDPPGLVIPTRIPLDRHAAPRREAPQKGRSITGVGLPRPDARRWRPVIAPQGYQADPCLLAGDRQPLGRPAATP